MRSHCVPLALAAALLVGCGSTRDDFPREAVEGTVTLDGAPLAEGTIQFLPTSPDQQAGATGLIRDGAFTLTKDVGPVPGSYKIVITSDSGEQPAMVDEMPGGSGTPNVDRIPAQYNTQSTLTEEVTAGGPNTYTFNLTS